MVKNMKKEGLSNQMIAKITGRTIEKINEI
jgi:hypothetical protein